MKKIIYIFIGCLLLTSCSGMLDIESHSAVSPGSVTPQDLSALRMGMYNKRRTGDICLLAGNDGDKHYKSTVQELSFRIPYRNTEGKRQHILFPGLDDVRKGTETISLHATSDCGLPVYYYVKEGPAEIEGNKLVFTRIPPRSKFPLKVTVVAWQYGLAGEVQTAEPVERSFFIYP